MTSSDEQARRERAEKVAYWRYQLIRDAADPGLSPRARGRKVRELAEAIHPGPFGNQVRVSRPTLDRWIRAWRQGGFDALLPPRRQCTPRTPAEVLDLASALKREQPDRTAAQVVRVLRAHSAGRRRNAPCCATSSGSSSTPGRTARPRPRSGGSRPPSPTSGGSAMPSTGR